MITDRVRFFLWFALLASVWLAYATWVADRDAETAAQTGTEVGEQVADGDNGLPTITDDGSVPNVTVQPVADESVPGSAPAAEATLDNSVTVSTDVLEVVINLDGGDLVRADLPDYPIHKDSPDEPVRLLDYLSDTYWVYQTGFAAGSGLPAPNHTETFSAGSTSYVLADNADELEVRLSWSGPNGLSAEKIYTFRRGEYAIDLELRVQNDGAEQTTMTPYGQLVRYHEPVDRSFLDIDTYSFRGPAWRADDEYHKIDFDDLQRDPIDRSVTDGWFASIQHHFLSALIPIADGPAQFETSIINGDRYLLRVLGDGTAVGTGADYSYPLRLFVGPKLQDQMAAAAPGRELKRTVDYGILYFLSSPLFWVLDHIHDWVRNWGLSIILTTFLIKLAFYKLTATSGRSMAKMRKIAPRMKALQEKHKDDRQALSAAMMDLYKKEKVNPAAGCLPILVQMPFFFAFYWVLVESVEMRQAPFALWITDLSVRDPFFILPGLMIAAMWFQMRLNPSPPDPVQARVMQIMPFFFGAMFAFFPAGLVLYWLTNTLVSIAQQWRINQLVARES